MRPPKPQVLVDHVLAVAEYVSLGAPSLEFCRNLIDWLTPDVTPDDPPESVVRLLGQLSARTASPLNLRTTSEALLMTSSRLRTRLNRMFASVAALPCPQVDQYGQPVVGSQQKVYLVDPLPTRLPEMTDAGFPPADVTKLTEALLAVTVARAMETWHPGRLLEGRAIGYHRTRTGTEVDFAALPVLRGGTDVRTTPIESKWVQRGWRSEAQTIRAQYGRGLMATKNILDLSGDIWAVPVGAIALLLSASGG